MNITTVLFDLDGTLVDNFDAIFHAFVHTQEALGLPPVSYEKVKRTVGGSAPVTMGKLIGEAHVGKAMPVFNDYFHQHFDHGLRALPGAMQLVQSLARDYGYRLGVFTNKNHEISQRVCDVLGFTPYLEAIEGSERPEGFRKPNPDFSRHILKTMQAAPEETVMIGDSPFDAEAARVVGMSGAYLVATGTHTEDELREATDTDGIFPDLPALARHVFPLAQP